MIGIHGFIWIIINFSLTLLPFKNNWVLIYRYKTSLSSCLNIKCTQQRRESVHTIFFDIIIASIAIQWFWLSWCYKREYTEFFGQISITLCNFGDFGMNYKSIGFSIRTIAEVHTKHWQTVCEVLFSLSVDYALVTFQLFTAPNSSLQCARPFSTNFTNAIFSLFVFPNWKSFWLTPVPVAPLFLSSLLFLYWTL